MGGPRGGRGGGGRRPPALRPRRGGPLSEGGRAPRYWTVEEARAYLPRLRDALETIRLAGDAVARAKANGHGPSQEQIDAAVAELADGDIVLRDAEVGLIDFHAKGADGVVYYLCFRADDPDLAWWHLPEEGFAGRKPLPRNPE